MCLQILNSEIQFANPQMQIMIRFTNKSKLHLNTDNLRRYTFSILKIDTPNLLTKANVTT